MQEAKTIQVKVHRQDVTIDVNSILYVIMKQGTVEIHLSDGVVHEVAMTLSAAAEMLGEGFVKIQRSCIVSARAIHTINSKVELINGELLVYSKENKENILDELRKERQKMIAGFSTQGIPATPEEYHEHYRAFDYMPFAFTDIEMVFNEDKHAVDWIFRYGNEPLAKLEKVPLERMIGSRFSRVFSNMDSKWLQSYERAALFGETIENIDFSPEINATIKVICFPTFPGHCGCILFDLSEIRLANSSPDAEKALLYYLRALTKKK